MSFEIKIPSVGESISEVILGQWLVEDGAMVEMDDPICELESEKATFELNAEVAGELKQSAKDGDVLKVGDVVGIIDESVKGSAIKKEDAKEVTEPILSDVTDGIKKTGQILDMVVPTIGESLTEVTIASWSKENGDFVEMDEVIAEIESDKATFELTAEAQGFLTIVAGVGETLEIGALICKIDVAEGELKKVTQEPTEIAQTSTNYASGHPSPAAGKIFS